MSCGSEIFLNWSVGESLVGNSGGSSGEGRFSVCVGAGASKVAMSLELDFI